MSDATSSSDAKSLESSVRVGAPLAGPDPGTDQPLASNRPPTPLLLRPGYLLVLLGCGIAAHYAAIGVANLVSPSDRGARAASAPPVEVVPASLDFGEVWEAETFRWNVVFHNPGEKPVVIRELDGTCGCTHLESGQIRLNPGERATVPLEIDLLKLRSHDPSDVRSVQISIVAKVAREGGKVAEHRWVLRGKVRRHLQIDPPEIGLGERLIRGEAGPAQTIQIRPNVPLSDLQLKQVPEGWSAELREQAFFPGTYVLRVEPRKMRSGVFADEFLLQATAEDGRWLPVQHVSVAGIVVEPIEVLPPIIDAGTVPVGAIARTSFWVSARDGRPVEVAEVGADDPLAQVAHTREEGKWRVDVERVIDAPGHGTLQGKVRARAGPESWSEVCFWLRWYGTAN